MNNWALLIPIAAITAGPLSWAFNTWVRAKHGYPLDDRRNRNRKDNRGSWGNWGSWGDGGDTADTLDADRKIMLLTNENEKLTGQVGRLEERLRVLERIATDPATRTAAEIEALRDRTN